MQFLHGAFFRACALFSAEQNENTDFQKRLHEKEREPGKGLHRLRK